MFGLETIVTRALFSSNVIANSVGKAVYKNADKILLTTGVGLVSGGLVTACLKSETLKSIKEGHMERLEALNAKEFESDKERGKAKVEVYKDTVITTLKTFGPCVLLTGTGIACIIGAHSVLSRRYASLQVAYTMLDQSFNDYRSRVKDAVGAKKEYELFNNITEEEIVETDENGKTVKKKVKNKKGANSPYTFIFDEANPNWNKDPKLNKTFLESRQWYANDLLHRKKIVTLAEILYSMDFFDDMRDIPSYCFEMIWQEGGTGDDEIIFGYQEDEGFMNGEDPSVVLNFNCDGLLRKVRNETTPILGTAKGTKDAA